MRERVINAVKVGKEFDGKIALNNISFHLNEGEIFGFLGPSGSGKTTTINILLGQLLNDSGDVYIFNKRATDLSSTDLANIGLVSDNSGFYEKLSLSQNLIAYAKLYGVSSKEVDAILDMVGLYEHKEKIAEKLSTGMKQRMLLARALINQPKVLFLDEPTSGLDPTTSKTIHQLLLQLKAKGTTIFLTTHDMNEATLLCDRLVLLNQGNIVESGTPKEIINRYNTKKKVRIEFLDGSFSHETFSELAKVISERELDILTIHSCEPTLEDVFIKLTGVKLNVQ